MRGRARTYSTRASLWLGLGLGVAVYATVTSGCAPEAAGARSQPPDVILVTIDTLRRDHVSSYGYPHRTTPFLDRLASEGVRFDRAYSPSPWTVPSVVTMLTSLYGPTHGVRWGSVTTTGHVVEQPVLGPELRLLSEILHDGGYQTFGVTANEHLRAELGFARGFDRYECVGFASGDALDAPLREIRARIDPSRPYFLWVHYLDPHMPYDSNRPELREWLDSATEADEEALRRVQSFASPEEFMALDPRDRPGASALARKAYDSDILLVDGFVERLFDLFDVDSNDLVIVTSDHGEEFHEHGGFGHGHALFDELLRIPLVVRLPEGGPAGRVVDDRVGLVDVLPTVLDLLGIEPPPRTHGISVLPLLEGEHGGDRVLYASVAKIDEYIAVFSGRYKMIEPIDIPGDTMLFDLEADPHERRNLAADHPDVVRDLRQLMAMLRMSRRRPGTPVERLPVPPEHLERLRSLGYLGPR